MKVLEKRDYILQVRTNVDLYINQNVTSQILSRINRLTDEDQQNTCSQVGFFIWKETCALFLGQFASCCCTTEPAKLYQSMQLKPAGVPVNAA